MSVSPPLKPMCHYLLFLKVSASLSSCEMTTSRLRELEDRYRELVQQNIKLKFRAKGEKEGEKGRSWEGGLEGEEEEGESEGED